MKGYYIYNDYNIAETELNFGCSLYFNDEHIFQYSEEYDEILKSSLDYICCGWNKIYFDKEKVKKDLIDII